MTKLQTNVLLAALGVLAAAAQLIATRYGITGDLVGGLLCSVIILAGMRLLALETEHMYLPPLVAAVASLFGLGFGIAGSGVNYSPIVWLTPVLAALPSGVLALRISLRGAKCQLCLIRLRGLLSFSCPRCHLIACENCWQFERGRCSLCEANQVALFPFDLSWWQERFGSQTRGSRCAFCLSTADWNEAQWACRDCGHSQCSSCWDDNNGRCSRCGWTIPGLSAEVSEFVNAVADWEKFKQYVSRR